MSKADIIQRLADELVRRGASEHEVECISSGQPVNPVAVVVYGCPEGLNTDDPDMLPAVTVARLVGPALVHKFGVAPAISRLVVCPPHGQVPPGVHFVAASCWDPPRRPDCRVISWEDALTDVGILRR